jgi:carbon starvation protein
VLFQHRLGPVLAAQFGCLLGALWILIDVVLGGAGQDLVIRMILLPMLALVVVKVLAESPWGIFTLGATIPIVLWMGNYLRFVTRWQGAGSLRLWHHAGVAGSLGGKLIYQCPHWSQVFGLRNHMRHRLWILRRRWDCFRRYRRYVELVV